MLEPRSSERGGKGVCSDSQRSNDGGFSLPVAGEIRKGTKTVKCLEKKAVKCGGGGGGVKVWRGYLSKVGRYFSSRTGGKKKVRQKRKGKPPAIDRSEKRQGTYRNILNAAVRGGGQVSCSEIVEVVKRSHWPRRVR